MRLRSKVFILIGVAALVAIVALGVAAQVVIDAGFARLERLQALEQIQRAQDLLTGQERDLAATGFDWSAWDDTYTFVSRGEPTYLSDNFAAGTLKSLRVDVMAFVDATGTVVHVEGNDDPVIGAAAIRAFEALTQGGRSALPTPEGTRSVTGVVSLPDGPPMLVAVCPILHSDTSGPAQGVVVIGRLIDTEELAVLSGYLQLPLEVRAVDSPTLPRDFRAALADARGPAHAAVVPIDEQRIASYGYIPDIVGSSGTILRVTQPRSVRQLGMTTIRLSIIWLVVLMAATWGVFYLAFERTVTRPLTHLRDDVRQIERGGESGLRVHVASGDEIGDLASSTNRMLDSLELSRSRLELSEERYRGLFESSPVAVLEADVSGLQAAGEEIRAMRGDVEVYLRAHPEELSALRRTMLPRIVNPAAVALYGAESAEALIAALPGLLASGPASLVTDALVISVVEGADTFEAETVHHRIDGTELHILLSCRIDADGRLLATAVDVTSRKLAELELERHHQELEGLVEARTSALVRANTELQEATDAKNQFLANMSHELRTPLNSILGFSGLMLMGAVGELASEQRRQISMIRASGQRLLSLVTDVLDLSKIEARMVEIEPSEFDANELVASLVATIEPLATAKGLRIAVELEDGDASAFTDRERVGEILLNFLSNAIKFTETGSVTVAVSASEGRLCFRVCDTGFGIPQEDQDRIFEQFVQLPMQSVAKSQGTGLGLTISQRLAALLRGTIAVRSEPGRGSDFELCVPAVYIEQDDPPEGASAGEPENHGD